MTPQPKPQTDWKTIVLVASLMGFGTMIGERAFNFASKTVKVVNETPAQDCAIKQIKEQNTHVIAQNDTIIKMLENMEKYYVKKPFFAHHVRRDSARFASIDGMITALKNKK